MRVERSDISGLFESLKCLFLVLAGLGSCLPWLDKTGLKMSDWIFHIPVISDLSTLMLYNKDVCMVMGIPPRFHFSKLNKVKMGSGQLSLIY